MSKVKSPFLSFESQGTVGNVLTTQRRGQDTIVRRKPIPTDPYSLPQAYQRWLYVDYAYLWTQQDAATRREYARGGSRFHLTGFQYWMKYHLAKLPDILAWWKLDYHTGATTPDSSRNAHTGTIIGATPAIGRINGCLSFDGVNDKITWPLATSFNLTHYTILARLKTTVAVTCIPIDYYDSGVGGWSLTIIGGKIRHTTVFGGAADNLDDPMACNDGLWHDVAILYDGVRKAIWRDTAIAIEKPWANDPEPQSTFPLQFGNRLEIEAPGLYWYDGLLDDVMIYTRGFDDHELELYSKRRYPA